MLAMYGLDRKYKKYFFGVSLNATLGSFCFGYEVCQMSCLTAYPDADISLENLAALSVAFSLGGIIGAYLGFPLSDTRGRRFGFFTADLITLLGAAFTCIGWTFKTQAFPIFLIARCISGVSIGIFSYLVPLYCILYIVREIVPTEISGYLISLHSIMIAFGHFISYVLTAAHIGKYLIYISICVPAIVVVVQAFLLYFYYDFETPSFLWLKSKRSEAMRIINRLYLIAPPTPGSSIMLEDESSNPPIISGEEVMKDPSHRKSLLNCIVLGAFTNLVGINTFLVYFPSYSLDVSGFTKEYQALTIYSSHFIVSFFIFPLIRYIGRVNLIKLGSLGMAVCMIIMAFRPILDSPRLYLSLAMIYIFFYQNSIGPIYYILSSDILIPKSFSISLTCYWIAFLIVDLAMSVSFLKLYTRIYIITIVCVFYALMCICLYVFCKVFLVETLKANKDEIEDKLKQRFNSTTQLNEF